MAKAFGSVAITRELEITRFKRLHIFEFSPGIFIEFDDGVDLSTKIQVAKETNTGQLYARFIGIYDDETYNVPIDSEGKASIRIEHRGSYFVLLYRNGTVVDCSRVTNADRPGQIVRFPTRFGTMSCFQ